jgi:hydrogenase maturation protease
VSAWEELERPGPDAVAVGGVELRRGSRVRLRPRPGGDVLDLALAGRTAEVDLIEEDVEGNVKLGVVVDDDPGRELGERAHRFFFGPDEVVPVPRVLVAGIGNVFLGDDGFGVALAARLAERAPVPGVDVIDFGIRGMDLAYAMQDGYDVVILLDAAPRGGTPGTLYAIEAEVEPGDVALDTHGMDPAKVLRLVQAVGARPPRTLVVGCEPYTRMTGDEGEIVDQLSEPVRAALDDAVELVESLLVDLLTQPRSEVENP